MELWFIYALIASFGAGAISFGFKLAAEHNYDGRLIVAYMFLTLGIVSGVVWMYQGMNLTGLLLVSVAAIVSGFGNAGSNFLKVFSLKYIDAAIFFPIYKTVGPFVVTLVGIIVFREHLSTYEIAGIAAGILVPLLLIHKSEHARQSNLTYGLVILVVSALLAVVSVSAQKVMTDSSENLWLFMTISGFAGFLVSIGAYLARHNANTLDWRSLHMRKTLLLGLLFGVIEVVVTYAFLRALETGLLGVVYTIVSFYILIPIVLAVWYYHEHMNARKVVAVVLSILSMIFFKI